MISISSILFGQVLGKRLRSYFIEQDTKIKITIMIIIIIIIYLFILNFLLLDEQEILNEFNICLVDSHIF